MARFVTLRVEGEDGWPITETWPTADRDEVAPCVNEDYPQIAPVLIDEVVLVTKTTTTKTGTTTVETYQTATGNKIADPAGVTEETGVTLSRVADPGGHLCVYAGDELLRQYEAGEWRSCSADAPEWLVTA